MAQNVINILLIEDSPVDAKLICHLLKKISPETYKVVLVTSLADAVAVLKDGEIDFVITDLTLPDADGLDTVNLIHNYMPSLPIIVLSGDEDEELAIRAMEEGAQDYLVKGSHHLELLSRSIRYATERKKVENKLRESEEKLQAILDCTSAYIYAKDTEGRYVLANRRVMDYLNLPIEKIIGQRDSDLFPNYGLNESRKEEDQILRDRKQIQVEETVVEGGEEKTYFSIKFPLLNSDDEPSAVCTISTDITERKELEKKNMLLAKVIECASELVVISNNQEEIIYVNPALEKATGYSLEELRGQHPVVLNCPDAIKETWEGLHKHILSGKEWKGVMVRLRKDGTRFEEERIIFSVEMEDGQSAYHVGIGRDITDRQNMENELRQAQKLESIGRLAAGIAHEINTPTQFVGDNTRFLKDSFEDLGKVLKNYDNLLSAVKENRETEQEVQMIESAAKEADMEYLALEIPKAVNQSLEGIERVSNIVRAMKDFSHMGIDEKVQADINNCITSTVTVSRNEWKYVAELELELDGSLPMVPLYPGDFNQVILNMITNAAHAIAGKNGDKSKEKGKISISSRVIDGYVEVRISDTGIGIPKGIRERIFDPFFTTKDIGKGTGQGLAICRSVILDKHGGNLMVESWEGEGSEFIIQVPLDANPESEAGDPDDSEQQEVEDNELQLQ
jgi:PAS domain S-box-containing protein